MNDTGTPFNGIFRADTRHAARHFEGGYRWNLDCQDSNECARAFFRLLDKLFDVLSTPGFVFLSGIELDVWAGRFPELLVEYFSDEEWDDSQSFFIAAVKNIGRDNSYYPVGRLTFEAAKGQTVRVIRQGDGFRWGANLRVWGLQVPESDVSEAIEMSPDNAEQVQAVHKIARAAWLADVEFNFLALWVSPTIEGPTRAALSHLSTP